MKRHLSLFVVMWALLACLFATVAQANDVIATNTNVNLRSGPGTQYERLTIIPSGASVSVEEKDTGNGWTKISYNGKTGYVVTRYLGGSTPAAATGNYVTTANVRLRSGAGTNTSVLATVPKGATVSVSAVNGDWATASYNGKNGYMAVQYLKATSGNGSTSTPATTTGNYVTTANVRLRSGAGTNTSVLATVPKGTTVSVSAVNGDWATASYNGQNGYMAAKYLQAAAGSTAAPTTPAAVSGNYVTTANVRLRSGAGTNTSVLTTVPKGAAVSVSAVNGDWATASYNGKNGYMAAKYLKDVSGSTSSTTTPAAPASAGSYVTTANLRLRSSASTSSSILATVPKGTTVSVSVVSNGWATVNYNGKSGYMSAQYLKAVAGNSAVTAAGDYVTTGNVNFRSGAGTNTKALGVVPKGTKVTVTSITNGCWAAASYNGQNGYIYTTFLAAP